ncbi:MAG: exodeoxyribonuclease VII large subunit [Pseudoflavonifractor sp.]|nr:exodeoxyribonuclease VII large subunit [Alloprevotella sp.]MCM1116760.1 exodeoxyribonuclease VII large subunit [Pseudoflavonifractor sp.]
MSEPNLFDSKPMSVAELSRVIAARLAVPELREVWVVGELIDLRASGGHCYMELIDKDMSSGRVNARVKAIMWANIAPGIGRKFAQATGQRLVSGLKVMVRGTINYHASFGLSFVISDINPSYTLGEAERRRREILARLQADGVMGLNRSLPWSPIPMRIAVISASGAAGYGDFVNQLFSTPAKLRFHVELFPAILQGERTVASCIAALDAIAARQEDFDCVVMIRGGGSSTDLQSFDDYSLALNVAQFPLPVIVGIGHERDVTILDYVAAMRVKTPTAAAEWLISRGVEALERLKTLGAEILAAATDRMAGAHTYLSYCHGMLPTAARAALDRSRAFLERSATALGGIGSSRIAPALATLNSKAQAIAIAAPAIIVNRHQNLNAFEAILKALSPEATLRRGFSVTRSASGATIRSAADVKPGETIVTILPDGSIHSIVND